MGQFNANAKNLLSNLELVETNMEESPVLESTHVMKTELKREAKEIESLRKNFEALLYNSVEEWNPAARELAVSLRTMLGLSREERNLSAGGESPQRVEAPPQVHTRSLRSSRGSGAKAEVVDLSLKDDDVEEFETAELISHGSGGGNLRYIDGLLRTSEGCAGGTKRKAHDFSSQGSAQTVAILDTPIKKKKPSRLPHASDCSRSHMERYLSDGGGCYCYKHEERRRVGEWGSTADGLNREEQSVAARTSEAASEDTETEVESDSHSQRNSEKMIDLTDI